MKYLMHLRRVLFAVASLAAFALSSRAAGEWGENYDEALAGPTPLQDPLVFSDGGKVMSIDDWRKRRAEIVDLFAKEMYGQPPPNPECVVTEQVDAKVTVGGFAVRRRCRMWFRRDRSGPCINWICFLPRHAVKPVPVVLFLNYRGNFELVGDADIPVGNFYVPYERGNRPDPAKRGVQQDPECSSSFPIGTILARGYAVMSACYAEVSPDPAWQDVKKGSVESLEKLAYSGVFDLWPKRDEARTDNPTSLGAWAWALSRGLDLASGIPEIDEKKAVVTGCSRLAKAALLAAVRDERFAVCVPVQTGGGGCPLAKHYYGENVRILTKAFPHWFCKAFAKYADKEAVMPFDQHLLLACVAPRGLLVEGFDDPWYDTKGEYLAVQAASPVWSFLGKGGMPDVSWPKAYETSAIGSDLGYVHRTEKHGISPYDWHWMLDFVDGIFARMEGTRSEDPASVPVCADRSVVIGNGSCEVVVAESAPPVVRFAADELTNFLFQATGERLPVRTSFTDGKSSIVLGTNVWSRSAGLDPSAEPRDTFFIRRAGSRLYICGNDDPAYDPTKLIAAHRCRPIHFGERATLFGVYEFLERFAGVRFYFPGELGTVVPMSGRIVVSNAELRVTPAMFLRSVSLGLPWYEPGAKAPKSEYFCSPGEVQNWFRLRLQTIRLPFAHGQNGFHFVNRFKDTHPEYFRMSKEGVRDFDLKVTEDHPFYVTRQLCHTSGVWEELYRDIRSYFSGEPESMRGLKWNDDGWGNRGPFHGRYVSVMPQDAFRRCYCENCLKTFDYDDPNFANEVIWSNTVSIANRLKAEGCDAVITQMAYRPYGMPPKVEIPENVEVMAAETGPWAEGDSETRELQVRHIESWHRKLGRKLFLWTYACKECWLRPMNAPCMAPRAVGAFYRRVSPWVKGVYNQGSGVESYLQQYLNFYVFSKMAWNPETDVEALLAEHHRLMFGAAAVPMSKFYDELERIWIGEVAVPGVIPEVIVAHETRQPTRKKLYTEIYSAKRLDAIEAFLMEGESLVAPDSLEAKRIALVRSEIFDPIATAAREFQKTIQ